jgi:predicted metal-binding membrane protein
MRHGITESILSRDRPILLGGVAAISLLSWLYLARMAADAGETQSHSAHMHDAAPGFWLMFVMWTVMMVAMMLPAASPFVLCFAAMHRQRKDASLPYVSTAIFLAGYFSVWTAFSAVAASLQQVLHRMALLSPAMTATSWAFAGGLLVAAGIYQWTPLKDSCLHHCRSPLGFLLGDWHDGPWGALRMGAEHGIFCLGCCWALMLLPFAAGVMNLIWMAALTAFILIEKVIPGGEVVGRIAGALLFVCGGVLILSALR